MPTAHRSENSGSSDSSPFLNARWFNVLHVVLGFGIGLAAIVTPDTVHRILAAWSCWTGWPSSVDPCAAGAGVQPTVSAAAALLLATLSGTASEMTMWLGHMWWPRSSKRTLPYWPLTPLGRWIALRPAFNATLSVVILGLCVLSCACPRPCVPMAAAAFMVACTVDGWRVMYSPYWLVSMVAVAAFTLLQLAPEWRSAISPTIVDGVRDDGGQQRSAALISANGIIDALAIIYGALYSWTGFFKLTSREFHDETATMVFEPVAVAARSLINRIGLATVVASSCGAGDGRFAMRAVSSLAVGFEMLLGIAILWVRFGPLGSTDDDASRRLLALGVSVSIFAMHAYICLGIALYRGIATFVSWNAACVAVVCAGILLPYRVTSSATHEVTSGLATAEAVVVVGDGDGDGGGMTRILLLAAVWAAMNAPPLTLLWFGYTSWGCWCHLWFVPDGHRRTTVLMRYQAAAKLPDGVEIFRDNTFATFAAHTAGGARGIAANLGLTVPSDLEGDAVDEWVKENTVCVGGEWVSRTFVYEYPDGAVDPCWEPFDGGPPSFWRAVVRATVREPVLRLVEGSPFPAARVAVGTFVERIPP